MSEPPESAGTIGGPRPGQRAFSPESRGGFREVKPITVRHVQVARKLAISETLNPYEQMRQRLEALIILDKESRRKHKINDELYEKAMEVYGVVLAFEAKEERNEGGYRMISIPFTQETEMEIENAFKDWLPGQVVDTILKHKNHLTPESAAKLETNFKRKMGPWVLELTAHVSDAIMVSEFDEAAGKISLGKFIE